MSCPPINREKTTPKLQHSLQQSPCNAPSRELREPVEKRNSYIPYGITVLPV